MDGITDILDDPKPQTEGTIDFEDKSPPKPEYKQENSSGNNWSKKDKSPNLWDDENIQPLAVDPEKLLRFNRMVCVASESAIDEKMTLVIDKVARELFSKGFTIRNGGDINDGLVKVARIPFADRELIYLPWKKFNPDLTGDMIKPNECGYRHSAHYHKGFKKVPPAVRAIIARTTNLILGEDCKTPVNLLICYTKDGASNTGEVDYKTTGNMSYIINLCDELNIPIFNLGKEGTNEKLLEFVKTFN
jgi:hypothetical protein